MLVRTEMRWPEQVKQAAEAKAGNRGLTAYVLALVAADLADGPPAVVEPSKPKPAPDPPRLVTADTPAPKPQTSACRHCSSCSEYRANPRRMLHCECGHRIADHR